MAEPACLAQEQLRTLDRLSKSPEIGKFYLAAGRRSRFTSATGGPSTWTSSPAREMSISNA